MRSTGEIISQTVTNLLARAVSEDLEALATKTMRQVYTMKLNELADLLGVTHAYMPRKLKDGRWDTKDIDKLAAHFDMYPAEFLPGEHDDWTPVKEGPAAKSPKGKAAVKRDPENKSSGLNAEKTE